MTGALASHYARALADAVFAPNSSLSPQDAVAQLRAVAAMVAGSKDLERALLSPAVTKSRKKAVISRLADYLNSHRLLRNFLLVLVSHRRIGELRAMRDEFELVVDERLGWVPAEITSARELSPSQREQVEHALGVKLGKFIRARYTVDAEMLAGVRARIAAKEYDATLRGKLDGMRRRLAEQL